MHPAARLSEPTPAGKHQNATFVRRQRELLQLVEAKGQMGVEALARRFGVSDDTVRRDLQRLERRKALLRTHRGAVPDLKQALSQTNVKVIVTPS